MSDNQNTNFPVLPSKDQINAGVFDKKDDKSTGARAEHFQAAPGPAIPKDLSVFENKLSPEEIKARTAELNKEGK